MEDNKILLKVVTPTRILYEKMINSVILRCIDGDMGILPGHEPCSVLLDYGALQVYVSSKELDVLAVFGGIATIRDNTVTVVSDLAALPDEIERLKQEEELEKSVSRIVEENLDIDIKRAEIALRRSLVKMDVSSYPIINMSDEEKSQKN